MKRTILLAISILACVSCVVWADTFGEGLNQFEIDFVTISGNTNPNNSLPAGSDLRGNEFVFSGVDYRFRIGTYEITNSQWTKFTNSVSAPITGSPSVGYGLDPYWVGDNMPNSAVSWYEAAQFVNWLNTSKGYQAAYKFTGTQGTTDYTFSIWDATDSGYDASNPYRNANAFYFLPSESEWVKAAYWNGTDLQVYATSSGETLHQGNGVNGTGWNYYSDVTNKFATYPPAPWNVGSGSRELNGTYDIMSNLWEWMESPRQIGNYIADAQRCIRGGGYTYFQGGQFDQSLYFRYYTPPEAQPTSVTFRIASIPEPATILLFISGLLVRNRKKNALAAGKDVRYRNGGTFLTRLPEKPDGTIWALPDPT